jgi:hypothetical protein
VAPAAVPLGTLKLTWMNPPPVSVVDRDGVTITPPRLTVKPEFAANPKPLMEILFVGFA